MLDMHKTRCTVREKINEKYSSIIFRRSFIIKLKDRSQVNRYEVDFQNMNAVL